jgi:glucokinase
MVVNMKNGNDEKFVVGIDFGATKMKAGVCNNKGELFSFVIQATQAHETVETVIERIVKIIYTAMHQCNLPREKITGAAIGACGLVDRHKGNFISSSVMPGWHNVPLAASISEIVKLPVILDNDANAAIFGEWWTGVGKGKRCVVGMTLGTGIGGGAILNNQLYYGCSDNSAEFGHMTVEPNGPKCFCGNRGCLGLLASANGMVQRCLNRIKSGADSILAEQASGGMGSLKAQAIYKAARDGDILAKEIIMETGKYLGIGTANLLNCFNPDMVIYTGGMTGMGDYLLSIIREEARSRTYPAIYENTQIQFGKLENKSGVIGAAGIFFSK